MIAVLLSFTAQANEEANATDEHQRFDGWAHIELGAGNYGAEGHTKKSIRMTVLMKLTEVSSKRNFVDELPEADFIEYNPKYQYAVLFMTLDELISREGPSGVFHVNDLFKEYADFAVSKLKEYAKVKGYNEVIIESVPGDYEKIDPATTLKQFKRKKYDSVHLKNPEVSFFHYGMDGNNMITSASHRKKSRDTLQSLADLGTKGLYFFPVDYKDYFIPTAEKEEFIDEGLFYLPTNEWGPVAYYFPEGKIIPKIYGRVFFIQATQTQTEFCPNDTEL